MGEALPVPWLHKQCSHVKAWDQDHKSSWLNQVPAPRSCGTASCCGRAGGSHRPLGGWRWLGRGRRQQRAGGGAVPSTALLSCRQPVSPPPACSSSGPDFGPHPEVSRLSHPGSWGGEGGNLRQQPPRRRRGSALPVLTETLQVTRDVMESRAKSPQPLGEPRAVGRGSRGPGEQPPAGEGGKGNPGRLRPAAPGRVEATPAGLRQQPRGGRAADVPAPRWPSCCRRRRETRAGCGRRSLSPGGRREGSPPARHARGAGAPSGPPRG